MSLSMYDLTIPTLLRGFAVLSSYASTAATSGVPDLVQARLAPDMLTLAGQVQRASDTAKFTIARLADVPSPPFDDKETTLAELRQRIDATVAWIESVDRAALEAGATRAISRKFGGKDRSFDGTSYVISYALPNFFFHVTTAYAILRHNGVAVGKLDYLGFAD